MLNRVLDKTIPPSASVVALVDQGVAVLPELLAALRGEGMPKSDIGAIMDVADKIAGGEEAWVRSGTTQRMKKVKRIVRKLVPVVEETPATFDAATPVSDFVAPQAHTEPSSDLDVERAFGMSTDDDDLRADINVFDENELIAGPLPNIDPVLFDILKSEVAAHLATIDGYLADLAGSPGLPVTEPLLRAVHTLNGAIAMVDIPVISQVLAPLEGYVKRLRARQQPPDAAGVAALNETSRLASAVIAELESNNPQLPNSDELAARVTQLRDTLPEPEMMHTLFSLAEDEAKPATAEASGADAMIEFETSSIDDLPSIELTADSAFAPEVSAAETRSEDDLTAAFIRELDAKEKTAKAEADAAAATQVREIEERMARKAQEEAAAEARRAAERPAMPEETELLSFDDLAAAEAPIVEANRIDVREALHPTAEHPSSDQIEKTIVALDSMPEVESLPDVAEAAAPSAYDEAHAAAKVEFDATHNLPDLPPLADDAQPDGKLELPDMDEDLLEIFVQEGTDILDHSDSLMAKLREAPQDRDLVTGMQRDLHTLKGGARMAGLAPIGDLSHAMESLLESISENRRVMDRVTVDSLERGYDRLHGLVQRVAHRQAIAMPENAIARFEGLVSGEVPVAAPATGTAKADEPVSKAPVAEVPAPKPAPKAKSATPAKPVRVPIIEEEDAQSRAPQEMIRVRSDLLDSLVNYAGEVSIYRSRLEQQISTFRFNLIEFETTVSRLRDQLRKLELETEAQILVALPARTARGGRYRIRSVGTRPFQPVAAVVARAGRIGVRLGLDSRFARRSDAPIRNAAVAAVARQFRFAGRPHAHAHGAVRFAGAVAAPHAAPGRAGSRQARATESGRCAGRNGPQPARAHESAVRAHAAQRARTRYRIARGACCRRQAVGRNRVDQREPRGDGSRAARVRRRQRHGPRRDPPQGHRARSVETRRAIVRSRLCTASFSKPDSPPPNTSRSSRDAASAWTSSTTRSNSSAVRSPSIRRSAPDRHSRSACRLRWRLRRRFSFASAKRRTPCRCRRCRVSCVLRAKIWRAA